MLTTVFQKVNANKNTCISIIKELHAINEPRQFHDFNKTTRIQF